MFRITCRDKIQRVIKDNPLGTVCLVKSVDDPPLVSSFPFVFDPRNLDKDILISHCRKGDQLVDMRDARPVTVVVNGADHYISPQWYKERNLVPTWNYISVVAKGRISFTDDIDETKKCVDILTDVYEDKDKREWENLNSTATLDKMIRGIVGIRIDVELVDAVFKCSQNRSDDSKKSLVENLNNVNSGKSIAMAEAISCFVKEKK